MTARLTPEAAIHDPSSQFRPNSKVIHRADPRLTVGRGNHGVEGVTMQPLRGWYPVELLHFPLRSLAQVERKASIYRASSDTRLHDAHRRLHGALAEGSLADQFRELVVDEDALERGLAEGVLAVDTRLRDVLRELTGAKTIPADPRFALPENGRSRVRLPRPSVVDDAAYAAEAAVLGEADTVRVQRRLDELEERLGRLETTPWTRVTSGARRLVRSVRRGSAS
jgi:hypothetical protein